MTAENVQIANITVVGRHRKELGDLQDLMRSIKRVGLLHPIGLTVHADGSYRLAIGERRLEAVKRLGWTELPDGDFRVLESLDDAAKLLEAERDENTLRKDMTPSELVSLGNELAKLLRPGAQQRQQEGQALGRAVRRGSAPRGARPETNNRDNRTNHKIGQALGVSENTWYRAKTVMDAAQAGDEHAAQLVKEMDSGAKKIGTAYKEHRAAAKPEPPAPELDPLWIPAPQAWNAKAVEQRKFLIRHYAGKGSSSEQMSPLAGLRPARIREIARKEGIDIPADRVVGKSKQTVDSRRVARETVMTLEHVVVGLDLIDFSAIEKSDAAEWAALLDAPMKEINAFVKKIKEIAR